MAYKQKELQQQSTNGLLTGHNFKPHNSDLFYEIEIGKVIDIITNDEHPEYNEKNIGYIKVYLLESKNSIWAKPLNANIKVYPKKNELIEISIYVNYNEQLNNSTIYENNKSYYYRANVLNIFNSLYDNTTTNQYLNNDIEKIKTDIVEDVKWFKQYYFKEGDVLYSGRYDNGLCFTQLDNYPEIYLYNNAIKTNLLSNISDIDSIICFLNNLNDKKYNINSNLITSNNYNDNVDVSKIIAQIFLRTKRVIIESYEDDIIMFSNNNIFLSSNNDISLNTNKKINLNAKNGVNIGVKANEQMVLGNTLVSLLINLIDEINKLTVLTNTGVSSTPTNKTNFNNIKKNLKKCLSKLNKIE